MAIERERNEATLTWASGILERFNVVRECDRHGYLVDRGDADALENAVRHARAEPPSGMPPDAAEDSVRRSAQSMPTKCPGCP